MRIRFLASLPCLAAVAGPLWAQTPPAPAAPPAAQLSIEAAAPPRVDDAEQVLREHLQATLLGALTLRDTTPLAPGLRAAADDIGAELRARAPALWARWLADLQAELPAAGLEARRKALNARLFNEWVLHELDEPAAALKPAWQAGQLAAWRNPMLCRDRGDAASFWERRLRAIQAAPEAHWPALLAAERELLQRWGQPRGELPAWPSPLPEKALNQALAAARGGSLRSRPAMSPMLARHGLQPDVSAAAMDLSLRCVAYQWWLWQGVPADGQPDAEARLAYRMAMLPQVRDWWRAPPAAASGAAPDYPPLAQTLEVTGKVLVGMQLDAQGQPSQVRVLEREIAVPGLRGIRALAYELELDAASVQRVQAASLAPPAAESLRDGKVETQVMLVWTLQ